MKLVFKRFNLYVLALLLVITIFPMTSYAESDTNKGDVSIISIDLNSDSRAKSLLDYERDIEGNISGLEDYAIDGRNTYVLNSTDNTILKFVEVIY